MADEYFDLITGKPLEPWAEQAMRDRSATEQHEAGERFDLIATQFDRLRAVERHLANGSHYADDDECHPLYPQAVAARQILEAEIARLLRTPPTAAPDSEAELLDGNGWVFWSPDSGEEYAPSHPIESGEVPDAERIRKSTAQEDVLWQAFQAEAERAHALSNTNTEPAGGWQQEQVEAAALRAGKKIYGDSFDPHTNDRQYQFIERVILAALTQPSGERPEKSS